MSAKSDLTAVDVMSAPVLSIPPETAVDGIERIMREHAIGALPVTDEAGRLLGIVTRSDLRRNLAQGESAGERTAADLMSGVKQTIEKNTPIAAIDALFETHRISHAPVLNEGRLLGMVSETDLRRHASSGRAARSRDRSDEEIRQAIAERLLAMEPCLDKMPDFCVADGVVRFWGTPPTPEELDAVLRAARAIET